MQKEAKRIGNGEIIILIAVAAFFDLASLIPFVGNFGGPVFWAGVAVYLWMKGYGLINVRRLVTMILSFVIEQIPGGQMLPSLIVGIIVIIMLTRIQNKTGISLKQMTSGGLNKGGVRAPSGAVPPPLNSGGVRMPAISAVSRAVDGLEE